MADREDLLIELYCDRPAGWADTLVQESAELVLTTGERLNWDFFLRWLQRRMKRGKALDPQFEARAEAIVNAAVKEALGKSISGASASSSAAGSADSRLR